MTDEVKQYRAIVEKAKSKQTLSLLNLIDCCKTVGNLKKVAATAKAMCEYKEISELEYLALQKLVEAMIDSGEFAVEMVNENLAGVDFAFENDGLLSGLKSRLWELKEVSDVIQFRNCLTDMFMVKFLNIGEYLSLNKEVDKRIEHSFQHLYR